MERPEPVSLGLGRWGSRSRPRGRRDPGVGLAGRSAPSLGRRALGARAGPRPARKSAPSGAAVLPPGSARVGGRDLQFSRLVQAGKHTCPTELETFRDGAILGEKRAWDSGLQDNSARGGRRGPGILPRAGCLQELPLMFVQGLRGDLRERAALYQRQLGFCSGAATIGTPSTEMQAAKGHVWRK